MLQEEPDVPADLCPLSTFSSATTIYQLHLRKPVGPGGGKHIDPVVFLNCLPAKIIKKKNKTETNKQQSFTASLPQLHNEQQPRNV